MRTDYLLFHVHQIRKHHYPVQLCTSQVSHTQPCTCMFHNTIHLNKQQCYYPSTSIVQTASIKHAATSIKARENIPIISVNRMKIEHKN